MKFKITFLQKIEKEHDCVNMADAASWAQAYASAYHDGVCRVLSIYSETYVEPPPTVPYGKPLKPYSKVEMLALGLMSNIRKLVDPTPGDIA